MAALVLGSDEQLAELDDVIACGFPFGQGLTVGKNEFPSISINTGCVSSLRKKDGALHLIQLDVVLNPGNSGGPVLDMKGKVVGVVLGGVRGAGINFAIPVSHVRRFVATPDLHFEPPTVKLAQANQPILFEARSHSFMPSAKPLDLELVLREGKGPERKHKMEYADGVFRVKAVAMQRNDKPAVMRLKAHYDNGCVEGLVEDASFKVGARELKLSDVRSLGLEKSPHALLKSGARVMGPISGLDAVAVRIGAEKLTINLLKAEEVRVAASGETSTIHCSVVAYHDGKEVGRVSRSILNNDDVVKTFLADLPVHEKKMGPWDLGKGRTGESGEMPIVVKGIKSSKGLGMHPPMMGQAATVKYRLGKSAYVFKASVAINDTGYQRTGDVFFEVLGDNKPLWRSRAINGKGQTDECSVEIAGVEYLELRTFLKGDGYGAHAVWTEPYVLQAPSLERTK